MGIHANATCEMNYDSATGYLLGEEHKGLEAMFTMMNEARLGVGVQSIAISETKTLKKELLTKPHKTKRTFKEIGR